MKNTPALSGIASRSRRVFCTVACLLPLCGFAIAQDTLVAYGIVEFDGTFNSHYNAVGGDIVVNKGVVGIYEIEITSPGAFVGATTDDFHVGLTIRNSISNHDAAAADVSFVDANTLTVDVYIADLEDAGNLSNPEARDLPFFFQIYRIPAGGVANPTSTGVLASGRVGTGGSLLGGVNAFGAGISAIRPATGEYELTVSGAGMFAGDTIDDYSLALTVNGNFNDDELIRGRASDDSSDDEIVFDIFIDDAQDTFNDNTSVPANNAFSFVIYRVPTATSPLPPASALLGLLARMDGTTGDLLSSATSFPGASIVPERTEIGDYLLTISAPGAFANRTVSDYSLQLQINDGNISDEFSSGRISLVDSSTMTVEVYVSDVEQDTEFGTPRDNDFSVLIMNAFTEVQSDMLVGKKISVATMIGEDVYSLAPGNQRLRVRSKKSGRARFYFGAENDGNLTRAIAVGSVGKIKGVMAKFFLLSGGRSNVTAAIKSTSFALPGMAPGTNALFEAKTKPKKRSNKKKAKIRLQGIDVTSGAAQDLVDARLKLRR